MTYRKWKTKNKFINQYFKLNSFTYAKYNQLF